MKHLLTEQGKSCSAIYRSLDQFQYSVSLRKTVIFLQVTSSSRFSNISAFPSILKLSAQTEYTLTRERESAYETTRHAATSPLAGRLHGVPGRMYLTTCSKHPDIANANRSKRPGVAIAVTTCKATQAECPYYSLLSSNTCEHRRAIRDRFSVAPGSTGFIGYRSIPRLFRHESIWDISASPYQRFLP